MLDLLLSEPQRQGPSKLMITEPFLSKSRMSLFEANRVATFRVMTRTLPQVWLVLAHEEFVFTVPAKYVGFMLKIPMQVG